MTTISFDRLSNIISHIKDITTLCWYSNRYISACLSENWDDNEMIQNIKTKDFKSYSSPNMIMYKSSVSEQHITQEIIDKIDKILNIYGYLSIELDLHSPSHEINHEFIVCQTDDHGQVICDSYYHTRYPSIRPFNIRETLTSLMNSPTISNWNNIWDSHHLDDTNKHGTIYINFSSAYTTNKRMIDNTS